MKKFTTTVAALMIMGSSSLLADGHKVKVGMITTLSGGGEDDVQVVVNGRVI